MMKKKLEHLKYLQYESEWNEVRKPSLKKSKVITYEYLAQNIEKVDDTLLWCSVGATRDLEPRLII